jgi:ubiquinone/menaquinone biosynthesis C-methylase UbiE
VGEDHIQAARSFYDVSAEKYAQFTGTEMSSATEGSVDRSLLEAFAELVKMKGFTRVADVGCGPGRAAAFMAASGLDVVGVDVSPAMLEIARRAHPDIQFHEGRLDELPLDTGAFGGVVSWYSIIYTPPQLLERAFAELARVLAAAGFLLVAFQAGDGETVQQGKTLDLGRWITAYRHSVEDVARSLRDAVFQVHATTTREADLEHESSIQAFVIARRTQLQEP